MNFDTPTADRIITLRNEAEARLLGRINYERADIMPYRGQGVKLARMAELLERLGNPQQQLKIVHVAGTKGKGSVSATIASVLSAAGLRTGLFTSPHLDTIEERMVVDGAACLPETFIRLVNEVWPHVLAMDEAAARQGGSGPTYFEINTAMAMLHFVQSQVDAAVLEVGLGGRLDSTNVCLPAVCVITSISFDHMKQLGNTLAEIAGEKAGIIKPGVTVISGVTEDEPAGVIRARAAEQSAPLLELGRDFRYAYRAPSAGSNGVAKRGKIDFETLEQGAPQRLDRLDLNLLGEHQARNAAVSVAALLELRRAGWSISEEAIRQGLGKASLPARVEVVHRQPTVIVDAAHNVASIQALVETLQSCFPPSPRLLLFATTKDKDAAGMLQLLLPAFDEIVLTRYLNNPRSVPPDELKAIAESLVVDDVKPRLSVFQYPQEAWDWAKQQVSKDQLICITGSFFFAAEMRRLLRSTF